MILKLHGELCYETQHSMVPIAFSHSIEKRQLWVSIKLIWLIIGLPVKLYLLACIAIGFPCMHMVWNSLWITWNCYMKEFENKVLNITCVMYVFSPTTAENNEGHSSGYWVCANVIRWQGILITHQLICKNSLVPEWFNLFTHLLQT